MGDWRIPYVWIGATASSMPVRELFNFFFRCVLKSPTRLAVGIKFDAAHGWNMREIDCSELGQITGVWEIGPIISADRWIPDVLCRSLPQLKGPHPLSLGAGDPEHSSANDDASSVVAPVSRWHQTPGMSTTSITASFSAPSRDRSRHLPMSSTSWVTWDDGRPRSSAP